MKQTLKTLYEKYKKVSDWTISQHIKWADISSKYFNDPICKTPLESEDQLIKLEKEFNKLEKEGNYE